MTPLITVLLITSAMAEMFGTLTVWKNYNRGARLAARLLVEVYAQDEYDASIQNEFGIDPTKVLTYESQNRVIIESAAKLRQLRRDVGKQLQRDWFLTAGLAAYVGGAVTGLAAGLIAVFR